MLNKIIFTFSDFPTDECLLCAHQSPFNVCYSDGKTDKIIVFMCGKEVSNQYETYDNNIDFVPTENTTHYSLNVEERVASIRLSMKVNILYDFFHKKKPRIFLSSTNDDNSIELPFQSLDFSDLSKLENYLQTLINFS